MQKAMRNLMILASVMMLVSVTASAEIIIQDDFSDNEVATPTVGTQSWQVASGSFAADGSTVDSNFGAAAGQLNFGTSADTSIYIDFGAVQASTPATVTLDLRQTNGTTGPFLFNIALIDTATGKGYKEAASPNPGQYGHATPGGGSGFHSLAAGDAIIATDASGALNTGLATDGQFDTIVMTFDPTTGVTFSYDGTLMASWSNYHGIDKVDRLELSHSGSVSWFVDNVSVDATVPEPASMSLLGLGGLALLRRRRK